jgi:hypothetical protein
VRFGAGAGAGDGAGDSSGVRWLRRGGLPDDERRWLALLGVATCVERMWSSSGATCTPRRPSSSRAGYLRSTARRSSSVSTTPRRRTAREKSSSGTTPHETLPSSAVSWSAVDVAAASLRRPSRAARPSATAIGWQPASLYRSSIAMRAFIGGAPR